MSALTGTRHVEKRTMNPLAKLNNTERCVQGYSLKGSFALLIQSTLSGKRLSTIASLSLIP